MIAKTVQYVKENILPLCILVTMIVGALTYVAKASDLNLVAMRLDQKIVSDQIFTKRQELKQLFRDYGVYRTLDCSKLPVEAYETCLNIKQTISDLEKKLKQGG